MKRKMMKRALTEAAKYVIEHQAVINPSKKNQSWVSWEGEISERLGVKPAVAHKLVSLVLKKYPNTHIH